MLVTGLKASELVKILQRMIEKHGDQYVFAGGADYPEAVETVSFQKDSSNPYVPKNAFKL